MWGTPLEASWAVWERVIGPLGPFGSIGEPRSRVCEICTFHEGNGPIFASRDPLGTYLGGLWGTRGDLFCRRGGLAARLWDTL
eukprot:4295915-Pyramimonas_sp.AAC.1